MTPRRVVQPGVIKLLVEADRRYQLTQRERITLALIAQTEGVSAAELVEELELPDAGALRPWRGRLLSWGLVEQLGRTKRRPRSCVRRALETLVQTGQAEGTGETRWRKYRKASIGHGEDRGQ